MKQLKATLCMIGDELLIGQVVNTNSAFLARLLEAEGIYVARHLSISDEPSDIVESLSIELSRCDILITTGGLGPTKDDRTKACLAKLFDCNSWKESAEQMEVIRMILSRRGIPMHECNKAQALVPECAEVIVNHLGTAPVMAFHKDGKALYAMPGVPFETEAAAKDVIADIRRHFNLSKDIVHYNIMTYGIAESTLSKTLETWEDEISAQGIHLAYLPSHKDGIKLRLSMYENPSTQLIEEAIARLKEIIPQYIYNNGDSTLAETLVERLREKGLKLAVAESCTGGYISSLFTSISGVSDLYRGSVTSYDSEVKHDILGVPQEIIDTVGVVSEECVKAMASGTKAVLKSDVAIATSGYAGPTGENVGQVWVGIALPDGSLMAREFRFPSWNSRKLIIERAAAAAIHFALSNLSE